LKIVIDSNILFSALIKNSVTRKMILEYDGFFLFPSFIFEELEKHKTELLKKSGMKRKSFETLLNLLLQKVLIVSTDVLFQYKTQAYELVKDIDPDDTLFIACALTYPESIIWSDDKKLKQQHKINILNTVEMYWILYDKR